jgi:hypothetical protein
VTPPGVVKSAAPPAAGRSSADFALEPRARAENNAD